MCNRKDEGGRCYAHLNQFIQSLDKREEQEIYNSAVQAGVPLDEEALKSQVSATLASCEQDREDYKNEVAAKKALMMELHAVAGKELKNSLRAYDRDKGSFVANPFVKNEPEVQIDDVPSFAGFEDAQGYIESHRFASAVAMERQRAIEQRQQAEMAHRKQMEKEAVRNNMELRSLKRQILMAEAKDFLHGNYGNPELTRLEKTYDDTLAAEVAKSTPFNDTEEAKELNERINKLENEFDHAEVHRRNMDSALQSHWHKTPSISYADQARHLDNVRSLMAHQSSDYAQLKGRHYAQRFRSTKDDYVRLSGSEPNWKARADKAVKDITKNPPLHKEAFETYKATVFPTTDAGKEIHSQRESAQKELVLTPTYRKNLKSKIDQMYYEGYDTTKERATLQKLDDAAAARKNRVASKLGKRPKREESEERSQGLYSRTTEARIANLDALADKLNNPPTVQERAQDLKNLAQRLNNR